MTADTPAFGLVIHQPARGFRYGAEAFWLAGFALEGPAARTAVDLGAGSGIVALLLARQGLDVLGIDVRPEWAPCWESTLRESCVSGRIRLECADVLAGLAERFDLVVSNPPFFPSGSGPVATDAWKAAARTEETATLADFMKASLPSLRAGGRACFVLPIERESEALATARGIGAAARRHVRVGRRRVLFEFLVGGSSGPSVSVTEEDPMVRSWYARATQLPRADA